MNFPLYLFVAALAVSSPLLAQDYQSVNDIESRLNPLEFVANYDGVRRSVDLDILFASGSADLLPEGSRQLDALGQAMTSERLAAFRFKLIGHTDAVGPEDYNLWLSQQRAQSVKQYLIANFDLPNTRLETDGKGEAELLAKLPPDDKRHRRVQVIALANDSATTKAKGTLKAQQAQGTAPVSNTVTKDEDGRLNIDW